MGTEIINGRYEVTAELGRGGMGIVYRAQQRSLKREVAIKMLSRDLAGDIVTAVAFPMGDCVEFNPQYSQRPPRTLGGTSNG